VSAFLNILNEWSSLFELVTTIIWAIFIYYTIRTFREIKRQTEMQSEAFLVVAKKIEDKYNGPRGLCRECVDLHRKWNQILQNHLPAAVRAEKYLLLELMNRGRSDIVGWTIRVTMDIQPSEYMVENFNTSGERVNWEVSYKGYEDSISPQGKIEVPIAVLGSYPEARIKWEINYTDIRSGKFSHFAGDQNTSDKNVLASPTK